MKTNLFRNTILLSAFVVLPLRLPAQTQPTGMNGGNRNNGGTAMSPAATNPTPGIASANPGPFAQDASVGGSGGVDTQAMKDKMFIRKAGLGGLAEVQLGQLAAGKASNDEVKKFGQKMVDDHTMLNEAMKPFADQMGVRTPSKMNKADQDEYDKLNGLSGTDFDKEYLAYMRKDHHMDQREFRMEEESTANPELKEAVSKGLKVIAEHTRMVNKLAAANGVPPPVRSH